MGYFQRRIVLHTHLIATWPLGGRRNERLTLCESVSRPPSAAGHAAACIGPSREGRATEQFGGLPHSRQGDRRSCAAFSSNLRRAPTESRMTQVICTPSLSRRRTASG